jgi:hypothetical protein
MRQINSAEASVPGALATVVARVIHVGSEKHATVPKRACRQGGCCTNIPRPDGSIIGTVRVCRTMCPAKDKGVSCTKNSGITYCTGGVNEPLESLISAMAGKYQALMSVTAGHVLRLLARVRRLAYGPFFSVQTKNGGYFVRKPQF